MVEEWVYPETGCEVNLSEDGVFINHSEYGGVFLSWEVYDKLHESTQAFRDTYGKYIKQKQWEKEQGGE